MGMNVAIISVSLSLFAMTSPEETKTNSHKITAVTVFSDQAQVTRSMLVKLAPGKNRFKFGGLLETILPHTIRAKTSAGKISQITTEQSFSKVDLKFEIRSRLERLETLRRQRISQSLEQTQTNQLIQFLEQLQFRSGSHIEEKNQTVFNENTKHLSSAVEAIAKQLRQFHTQHVSATQALEKINREIDFVQKQLEKVTLRENQKWKTDVWIEVESSSRSEGKLEVLYRIPNAKWYAQYDVRTEVHLAKNEVDVNLVSAALVEQHTGEDWKDVQLQVSSLDPQPLLTPALQRWLLKERRIEVAKSPRVFMKDEVAEKKSLLKAKDVDQKVLNELSSVTSGDRAANIENDKRRRDEPHAVAAPKALSSSESLDSVSKGMLSDELHAGKPNHLITTNFALTPVSHDFPQVVAFEKSIASDEPVNRELSLEAILEPQHSYSDGTLPAVQAGGRKLEFTSAFPVSLQNDESPKRISLFSQKFKGRTWHYAVPKLDSRVFIKAVTTNTTDHPLLGGNAQIFVDGDLLHKTFLGTVSEDSSFEMDLGVDPEVKISRVSTRKSEATGLPFFKKHENAVTVKIEIVNHHKFPINLQLQDHFPHSSQKEMESKLTNVSVKPEYISDWNTLQWRLDVPAGQKRIVEFTYQITYPEEFLVAGVLD
jgi:hypothetical protein